MEIAQRGRVTVSQVAECAGVSRATVYAVLNEHKEVNIRVSEPIRRKVREAIEKLGYIPNETARTLVSGRSRTIGMILPDSGSNLIGKLTSEISRFFLERGFMVIPNFSDSSVECERALLNCFLAKNVDALIYTEVERDCNRKILDKFHEYGITTIGIGLDVKFDEPRVMELAVAHAIAAGAARIGFLGYRNKIAFSVMERLHYLKLALLAHPELRLIDCTEVADYRECRGYAGRLAAGGPDCPEVVICYNDHLAALLVQCLLLEGVRIPDRIGVIGIDGLPDAFNPMALTSVRLPIGKMVETIWNLFYTGRVPEEAVCIAPELIAGETTNELS